MTDLKGMTFGHDLVNSFSFSSSLLLNLPLFFLGGKEKKKTHVKVTSIFSILSTKELNYALLSIN